MEEEVVEGSSNEKAVKRRCAAHGWPVVVEGEISRMFSDCCLLWLAIK
ncbi:hypothetical protein COLO4_29602 [Corchorus olitorius]|uniref:Uncharacterized protein n=1 Tax=Corchorus olitorius TaxID=93759 RepID=A0A1R3HDZ0_9ROSI|nr:hypothetical protein COLO4_29602 [Corchorus olitorius]